MNFETFSRLKTSAKMSYQQLKPFRESMLEAHKQYVGENYGDEGSDTPRPLNQLELATVAYLQSLAAKQPQVLVLTHRTGLKLNAIEMEYAINLSLKNMDFEAELKVWVLSSLFSVGFMKVGIEVTDRIVLDDESLSATNVFAEAIQFQDMNFDTTATKWDNSKLGYIGHRYQMTLEELQENPDFNKDVVKNLAAREMRQFDSSGERMEGISHGRSALNDEFLKRVDVWDLYVPSTNEIITYTDDAQEPLRESDWDGPENGPYHMLGFNPVLANLMPLPPVSNWLALDDLTNRLLVQLGRQASRQKTVTYATAQAEKDAETVIKSNDGDTVLVDNPGSVKEMRFGGVDQQTHATMLSMKGLTSYVMGNLDSMIGLGQSADTLGQERIIKGSSSERLRSMQSSVVIAVKKVVQDIAFWLWRDPLVDIRMTRQVEGTDMNLETTWPYQEDEYGVEQDMRQGDFGDYDFDIEPYSMQDLTPGERLQMLRSVWREDIMPVAQFGLKPDVHKYLKMISKYGDLPELTDLVPALSSMDEKAGDEVRKPPVSSREYVRKNVSAGMTPQANEQQMIQALMSAGQDKQGAN